MENITVNDHGFSRAWVVFCYLMKVAVMRAQNDSFFSIKITHICTQFEFHSFGTIEKDILKIGLCSLYFFTSNFQSCLRSANGIVIDHVFREVKWNHLLCREMKGVTWNYWLWQFLLICGREGNRNFVYLEVWEKLGKCPFLFLTRTVRIVSLAIVFEK